MKYTPDLIAYAWLFTNAPRFILRRKMPWEANDDQLIHARVAMNLDTDITMCTCISYDPFYQVGFKHYVS